MVTTPTVNNNAIPITNTAQMANQTRINRQESERSTSLDSALHQQQNGPRIGVAVDQNLTNRNPDNSNAQYVQLPSLMMYLQENERRNENMFARLRDETIRTVQESVATQIETLRALTISNATNINTNANPRVPSLQSYNSSDEREYLRQREPSHHRELNRTESTSESNSTQSRRPIRTSSHRENRDDHSGSRHTRYATASDSEHSRLEHEDARSRNPRFRQNHQDSRFPRQRYQMDSSSEEETRNVRFNRKKPTNPSQWNFVFSGDPKGSNHKETTPYEFLSALEAFRHSEKFSKSDMLSSLNQLFTGTARKWWMSRGKHITSYSDFVKAFKDEWFPESYQVTLEYDLMRYKQKDESVTAFLVEFENRAGYLDTKLSQEKMVGIARRNINDECRKQLALKDIRSFSELKRICKRWENAGVTINRIEKPKKPEEPTRRQNQPTRYIERRVNEVETSTAPKPVETDSDENPYEVLYIARQPKSDKQTGENANENERSTTYDRIVVCFNCDGHGHRWRGCKEPRKEFCMGCGKKGVRIPNCSTCAENYWARTRKKVEPVPANATQ